MDITLDRKATLNIPRTVESSIMAYDLGPVHAYVAVRIPVRLAYWLLRREDRRKRQRDDAEETQLRAACAQAGRPY